MMGNLVFEVVSREDGGLVDGSRSLVDRSASIFTLGWKDFDGAKSH